MGWISGRRLGGIRRVLAELSFQVTDARLQAGVFSVQRGEQRGTQARGGTIAQRSEGSGSRLSSMPLVYSVAAHWASLPLYLLMGQVNAYH